MTTIPPHAPRFIVFEGPDGVGKSTQAARLAERIEIEWRATVARLREPTDGPWGRKIREAARTHRRPDPREEARWFTEDRREDVARNICPALAAGQVVILDRYFYSTAAYQGAAGVPRAEILAANREFAPEPDVCFVLLCAPELARERIVHGRGDAPDAFEAVAYQQRVADEFRAIVAEVRAANVCPMVLIDSTGTPDEIAASIWAKLAELATPKSAGGS